MARRAGPAPRTMAMQDPIDDSWELDRAVYRRVVRASRVLRPYFRPRYQGFEVFQRPGGIMVVANHGLFALEAGCLVDCFWEGAGRPIRGLGDHLLYATKLLRVVLARSGGVEGTPENAYRLLTRGDAVYVNPGGAREALASADDRYKLFWDGHVGYVRAAIRAGVPIVPLAVIGSDELYRQLYDAKAMSSTLFGRLIQKTLGAKYVTPVYLGLGPLPLPVQLRFLAGEAIEVPRDPSAATDEAVVGELHARARRSLEALIAHGLEERAREHAALPTGLERTLTHLVHRFAGEVDVDALRALAEGGEDLARRAGAGGADGTEAG